MPRVTDMPNKIKWLINLVLIGVAINRAAAKWRRKPVN